MTCTVGPASAIVIDVVHPGVRATGCSVLALFQNLFGLARSLHCRDALGRLGLETALTFMPVFGLLAATAFVIAARSYGTDKQRVREVPVAVDPDMAGPVVSRGTARCDTHNYPEEEMNGSMMQQPLLISTLLTHAERHHGEQEIVSRRVEGDVHR